MREGFYWLPRKKHELFIIKHKGWRGMGTEMQAGAEIIATPGLVK